MTFLTFPDLAAAQAANGRASEYLVTVQHGHNSWSDIYTDGTSFGIAWCGDPCAAVFGPATLTDGTPNPTLAIVTDEPAQDGESKWTVYVPPQPPTDPTQ